MQSGMKVLIVSHSYVVAENQKNIDALAKYIDPLVVVPNTIIDSIHGSMDYGVHRLVVAYKRLSLWGSQYLLCSLGLGMRQFKPQLIHVEYDPWSVVYWQVWFSSKLFARNAKLICTVKNNTYRRYPSLLGWLKHSIARFFIKRCDFFIAINKGAYNIYHRRFNVPASKLQCLQHLGIDTRIFFPMPKAHSSVCHIGFCGRFEKDKGILDLIAAITPLAQSNTGIKLSILGAGQLAEQLRCSQLPWLTVLDRVPHPKVADFMQSLDVFVLPSQISDEHEEHDAHVLLEAMACGVSVIGSSSGIIPEIIGDHNGLLFSAGNVSDLKDKLNNLIESADLRRGLAENALDQVHLDYSIDALASHKQKIYQRVLQKKTI